MVIFLAGFAPGQGALPASRRVFHAPLTGRKTGDTGANYDIAAKHRLAHLARVFQQLATNSGRKRQFAAKGGMGSDSEPERARLKDVRTRPSKSLSAHQFFGALCRKMWCTVFC
ncbi:MAG: hypothetical protein AAFY25_07085 [Pseudomonadota bacterium]